MTTEYLPTPIYILDSDTREPGRLGGKAHALAQLAGSPISIPAWFVVTPTALWDSLDMAGTKRLQMASSAAEANTVFDQLTLSEPVERALSTAIADRFEADGACDVLVAVRSSALDEDGAAHSFAGQLDSFLNVPPADVPRRVIDVWRSGFGARIYAYRREHGLSLPPPVPAVLVQKMVRAEKAGVAFGADPISGRRGLVIVSAVIGLGDKLVSGERSGETLRISQQATVIEREPEVEGQVPAEPVLNDSEALEVARVTMQLGRHFQRPQDVEWAYEQGQLYVLQSRPITTLARIADPDGVPTLWDNSNIVESYGGMTTPLTYTFARRAYTEVYQEFCRILGVPESVIATNKDVYANMIGLIRGRIYYNLLNWYRVLAMLPGFRLNRTFMEQMMGVREPLPDAIVEDLAAATWRQRLLDGLLLARSMASIVLSFVRLPHRKRRFHARLQSALGETRPDLYPLRADELIAYYRQLDGQLLHRWDAPLLNDFYAMIFYGVLRRLVSSWCRDTHGSMQNDLLAGEGGMISAEPARLIEELAQLAIQADDKTPGFVDVLRNGTVAAATSAMLDHPEFACTYEDYLDRFGERCLNELKLESQTLVDDAKPLLRAIGNLAKRGRSSAADDRGAKNNERHIRQSAEETVAHFLANRPLRRLLFRWVLANTRRLIRDRENLRFERTRVFGRARQIFRELGGRLYAVDKLEDPNDVFHLELGEIIGFAEGTATSTDLATLVALRKAELAQAALLPPPASRFVTYGMVYQGNNFAGEDVREPSNTSGSHRQGIGCCPGKVRGRARVVDNPLHADFARGDILVAEHTDPSWIMIMPLAAGILVARGSLLSHTAIVARELGIPAVVSLPGITEWLQDGDMVEFDGRTGDVYKLSSDASRSGADMPAHQ